MALSDTVKSHVLPVELLLLASATLANAVSLSDFSPKCSGLTPECQSVYQQSIPGCSASDFSASCSPSCIAGMFSMNNAIFNACAGEPSNNQNIIEQFIVGSGVQDLCPNAMISTVLGGGSGGMYGTSLVQSAPPTQAPPPPPQTNTPPSSNPPPQPTTSAVPPPVPVTTVQSVPPTTAPLLPLLPSSSVSIYVPPPPPITSRTPTPTALTPLTPLSSPFLSPLSSSTPASYISSALAFSSLPLTIPPPELTTYSPNLPHNNPPTALTGTDTLSMLPSPTLITTGIQAASPQQTTGCVPNGGGGSLIGDHECSSNGAAAVPIKSLWSLVAMVAVGVWMVVR